MCIRPPHNVLRHRRKTPTLNPRRRNQRHVRPLSETIPTSSDNRQSRPATSLGNGDELYPCDR